MLAYLRPQNVLSAATLGSVLMLAPRALAQSSDADLNRLYEQGTAAMDSGNWDEANRALSQLWAKQRSGRVAGLLGQTEHQLGKCPEAIDHLMYALGDLPPDRPANAAARLTEWINDCKTKVAVLNLDVEPATAMVLLNGKPLGTAKELGTQVFANPGKIQVLLTQDGYRAARLALEVPAGQSGDVKVALEPEARPATGSATAKANGESHMTAPSGPGVDTGGAKHNWVPAYVLGGVALASGAVSFWLRSEANSDADKVRSFKTHLAGDACTGAAQPAACNALRVTADQQRSEARWSNVTLVLAGVTAAATVGYVTYEIVSSPSSSASTHASLAISPTGAGLLLDGRF